MAFNYFLINIESPNLKYKKLVSKHIYKLLAITAGIGSSECRTQIISMTFQYNGLRNE